MPWDHKPEDHAGAIVTACAFITFVVLSLTILGTGIWHLAKLIMWMFS